jgi:hypothetical protein
MIIILKFITDFIFLQSSRAALNVGVNKTINGG